MAVRTISLFTYPAFSVEKIKPKGSLDHVNDAALCRILDRYSTLYRVQYDSETLIRFLNEVAGHGVARHMEYLVFSFLDRLPMCMELVYDIFRWIDMKVLKLRESLSRAMEWTEYQRGLDLCDFAQRFLLILISAPESPQAYHLKELKEKYFLSWYQKLGAD